MKDYEVQDAINIAKSMDLTIANVDHWLPLPDKRGSNLKREWSYLGEQLKALQQCLRDALDESSEA